MTLNDGSLTRTAPLMTDVVPPVAARALAPPCATSSPMIRRNLLHIGASRSSWAT